MLYVHLKIFVQCVQLRHNEEDRNKPSLEPEIIFERDIICIFEQLLLSHYGCRFGRVSFINPSKMSSTVLSPSNGPSCSDPDKLPTPVKPSLKMRLFRNGGDTREKLCAMFERKSEDKENNENDIICLD